MKALHTLICSFLLSFVSASAQNVLSLIPLPSSVEQGEGTFVFSKKSSAFVDDYPGDSIQHVFDRFAANFSSTTGIKMVNSKLSKASIRLLIDSTLSEEAYRIDVTKKNITISAARPVGFFYALQTFAQLLPSRNILAGKSDNNIKEWSVPVVTINDAPRFGWRGFMLDEGRHFYGKESIKKMLDVMAVYKLNRFHWHLTEDQGWRIEIKKYPRLTSVGAWRESNILGWGDVKPQEEHYGGFYTQDDIKEVVKYARELFIEIVPEVDIPGHSQAAVAAYPEFLACDPENKHEVWLYQGVSPDVINVANPKAVQFAKDVIDELTELFPFGYLHLGGDECPTTKWEKNTACQERLEAIGTNNYRDLQIDFYRQLHEHIASKPAEQQRKLIFWNEVLHGNTSLIGNDFTVMAWIGADKAARSAAEKGLTTILSPQIPYYINRKQSTLPTEPLSQGHGTETVEAVYNYVPMKDVPQGLTQKYLGVQANFWTEWVKDFSTVEYLMFPRLAAVAEAGWTPQNRREYSNFLKRLQSEASFYKAKGINYGKHVFASENN